MMPYSTFTKPRKALKPISDKRRALIEQRKTVEKEIRERDKNRCQFSVKLATYVHEYGMLDLPNGSQRCMGPTRPHEPAHRRNSNLLDANDAFLLCDFHNGWVEDNPVIARVLGLSIEGNGLALRHVNEVAL